LLRDCWSQLKTFLLDAEHLLAQRLAGTVFLIRVVSALLAFGSQVLFARWMGSFEFGIYVYVWTWVLLFGQAIDLGLGTAAQRFIPEYRERGLVALLRGFVSGSRWVALTLAIVIAAVAAGCVKLIEHRLDEYTVIPLYLACIVIPAYALANVQEGIARSYDWVGLSMMPLYVVRQLLLTVLMAGAYVAGLPMDAITAMIVAAVSIWLPIFVQLLLVNRRLSGRIAPGPKAYDFKTWLLTALPILMVGGFYSLLAYSDVLVLQYFRAPDEVAVYYAAVKTLALVSFIYYSVSATAARRFSGYQSPGIMPACRLSFLGPSNGRSGHR
jgi:O-antigen/teichoic acid export membrane protein